MLGELCLVIHDGLPLIGTHPDYPHSYFVEGYGETERCTA